MICLAVPFVNAAPSISDKDVKNVLGRLDKELSRREDYKRVRIARIDSLRRNITSATDRHAALKATMALAVEYNAFNNDSALHYYTKGLADARNANEPAIAAEFLARRATYLALSGFISDAIDDYAAVDTTLLDREQMAAYHEAGRQMYSYISNFYEGSVDRYDHWNKKSIESQRMLLETLDPTTDKYRQSLGEYYFSCNDYAKARGVLLRLLETLDKDTSIYPVVCHILASIAKTKGDFRTYIYYLALSAIADTRRATLEVVSLQELGGALFESGVTDRAHTYLTAAMNNAVEGRAAVRMAHVTELLNIVELDHMRQISRWKNWTTLTMVFLALCLIALGTAMFFLNRQLRSVAQMKEDLKHANKTKEIYISQFMTLCSIYMDKLKEFCKLADRKITSGKADDLLKIVKSGKFIDQQSKDFYSVFDDAFLHLYPSFIEKVNALLKPDEQIRLNDSEIMNTDLRILAFMRLGIDDTQRVAQILNYSVNTIYAYRNKLRNRAINRDTFEADIVAINAM